MSIPLVLVFYGLLGGVAVVWDALREGPSAMLPHEGDLPLLASAAIGIAFAGVVLLVSRLLERRFAWARALSRTFADILGPLRPAEIAVYAAASGVAEEMFFRGAVQPAAGIVVTSLIFGLSHGLFERRLVPWMAMAAVVGLGLGALMEVTGNLIASVLAHFLVNYFEFHALDRLARGRSQEQG